TAESIARHLREYFSEAGPNLPAAIRLGLRLLPEHGPAGQALAWLAKSNARRLARRFIAGSNLAEAVQTIAELRRKRLAFTVDLLGEATITEAEADAYQGQYLELVEGLSREINTWPAVECIDSDDCGPIPRV